MASKNKQILNRESVQSREFSYATGNVSLKFTLRTDVKSQLVDFLKLLNAATEDVTEEVNKSN
jgi:hypothetical protein